MMKLNLLKNIVLIISFQRIELGDWFDPKS